MESFQSPRSRANMEKIIPIGGQRSPNLLPPIKKRPTYWTWRMIHFLDSQLFLPSVSLSTPWKGAAALAAGLYNIQRALFTFALPGSALLCLRTRHWTDCTRSTLFFLIIEPPRSPIPPPWRANTASRIWQKMQKLRAQIQEL